MLVLLAVGTGAQAQFADVTGMNIPSVFSDSQPEEPVLLSHAVLMELYGTSRDDRFALAAGYNAAPVSPIQNEHMDNSQNADGQIYYLEGGKTYVQHKNR